RRLDTDLFTNGRDQPAIRQNRTTPSVNRNLAVRRHRARRRFQRYRFRTTRIFTISAARLPLTGKRKHSQKSNTNRNNHRSRTQISHLDLLTMLKPKGWDADLAERCGVYRRLFTSWLPVREGTI